MCSVPDVRCPIPHPARPPTCPTHQYQYQIPINTKPNTKLPTKFILDTWFTPHGGHEPAPLPTPPLPWVGPGQSFVKRKTLYESGPPFAFCGKWKRERNLSRNVHVKCGLWAPKKPICATCAELRGGGGGGGGSVCACRPPTNSQRVRGRMVQCAIDVQPVIRQQEECRAECRGCPTDPPEASWSLGERAPGASPI